MWVRAVTNSDGNDAFPVPGPLPPLPTLVDTTYVAFVTLRCVCCSGCVKDSAPHCYHCGVWIICFRINVNVANETEVAKKAAGKAWTWRLNGTCRLHAPLTRSNTPVFLSFRCGYRESRRSDL